MNFQQCSELGTPQHKMYATACRELLCILRLPMWLENQDTTESRISCTRPTPALPAHFSWCELAEIEPKRTEPEILPLRAPLSSKETGRSQKFICL